MSSAETVCDPALSQGHGQWETVPVSYPYTTALTTKQKLAMIHAVWGLSSYNPVSSSALHSPSRMLEKSPQTPVRDPFDAFLMHNAMHRITLRFKDGLLSFGEYPFLHYFHNVLEEGCTALVSASPPPPPKHSTVLLWP